MKRLIYIDYLRGLAIVFMVINHVGHYFTAAPLHSYGIYWSVYLTVTWAAPLFLFLAGFSLAAVEKKKYNIHQDLNFSYFWRRGWLIILAGFLINIFFYFNEDSWYFGRVLLVIGSGIIISYPLVKFLKTRQKLFLSLFLGLILILFYPLAHNYFVASVASQSVVAKLFLGEFPIYPWIILVFIGVIFGKLFLGLNDVAQKLAVKRLGIMGMLFLMFWLAVSLLLGRNWQHLLNFTNDFNLNGFWLPSELTWVWIFGSILVFLSLTFTLGRLKDDSWLRWLKILGNNALAVYFLQFFIIKTVGGEWLEVRLINFYQVILADLIVILILCYLVKSKIFAKLMALNPLAVKGKIS